MAEKITVTLSADGIEKAIGQIRAYQADIRQKTLIYKKRLSERLSELVESGFNQSSGDDVLDGSAEVPDISVSVEDSGEITIVSASGKEVVFIEFGAGVYHNGAVGSSPHPNGEQLSFTIGSYGQGKGAREVWGYYDESGALKLTHGTPASMPMYNAVKQVIAEAAQLAREVFS